MGEKLQVLQVGRMSQSCWVFRDVKLQSYSPAWQTNEAELLQFQALGFQFNFFFANMFLRFFKQGCVELSCKPSMPPKLKSDNIPIPFSQSRQQPCCARELHSRALGSDVFPTKVVPFKGTFVSFQGCSFPVFHGFSWVPTFFFAAFFMCPI